MGNQTLNSERRWFLQSSLGLFGVIPLCCTTPQIPPDSAHYQDGNLAIDLKLASALRPGSAAAFVDPARKLDLIIARTDNNHFAVLDRSCTHAGAQCNYNHKRHTVQCTSLNHAEYDLRGTLLHGRTHGNLRVYEAWCRGDRLEIRLEA